MEAHSLLDKIMGFQYNGDCWILKLVEIAKRRFWIFDLGSADGYFGRS